MTDASRYIATLRVVYDAESEVDAVIVANDFQEAIADRLDHEDETVDVTQVIPATAKASIEPTELVNQMRVVVDMLITTKIKECFDLAQWVHRTAWVLEHRMEETFDVTGYDYGDFMDHATDVLKRLKREVK